MEVVATGRETLGETAGVDTNNQVQVYIDDMIGNMNIQAYCALHTDSGCSVIKLQP